MLLLFPETFDAVSLVLSESDSNVRTFPSKLVPAEYGTIGTRCLLASRTTFTTSSVDVTCTITPWGVPVGAASSIPRGIYMKMGERTSKLWILLLGELA